MKQALPYLLIAGAAVAALPLIGQTRPRASIAPVVEQAPVAAGLTLGALLIARVRDPRAMVAPRAA